MISDKTGYERWLKDCQERIKEYSKGIKEADIQWLTRNIIKHSPRLSDYQTNPESRVRLLDRLASILSIIQYNHPADIRAFVEKKQKENSYDERLRGLIREAGALNIGDDKKYDEIEKKLKALLKMADKDFPDYSAKRDRPISELRGDLIAIKTKGKMGSTRKIMQLLGQRNEPGIKRKQKS